MSSTVSRVTAASSEIAAKHFAERLAFETDCWDVCHAITNDKMDFVLLDVRAEESYSKGHLPKATHLSHWKISEKTLQSYPPETLFVTYCAGPHCNGSTKGALAIAKLGRPVKEMIGGVTGWLDEGFQLES